MGREIYGCDRKKVATFKNGYEAYLHFHRHLVRTYTPPTKEGSTHWEGRGLSPNNHVIKHHKNYRIVWTERVEKIVYTSKIYVTMAGHCPLKTLITHNARHDIIQVNKNSYL